MQKYELFDYKPHIIYGETLQDALERQHTLTTEIRYRSANTASPESYGGETLTISKVVEVLPPDTNRTRGNKMYEQAIVELDSGKIIEVDACEISGRGRPTFGDQPMRQTAVWLPEAMIAWLKAQPDGGMGETLRRIIKAEMDRGA